MKYENLVASDETLWDSCGETWNTTSFVLLMKREQWNLVWNILNNAGADKQTINGVKANNSLICHLLLVYVSMNPSQASTNDNSFE